MKRFPSNHADLSDKQRMRRFIASPLTLVCIAVFIAIVANASWNMYQKWRMSREVLAEAHIAYDKLVEREAFLNSKIELLSTSAGIEAEVRDRFGVAKEGEKVIVILEEEQQGALIKDAPSFWERLKGWFTRD